MSGTRRYDDEVKGEAVARLQAYGYPDKVGSLSAVSKEMGIPTRTLRRWFKGGVGAPSVKIVRQQKRDMSDRLGVLQQLAADEIERRIERFAPRELIGLLKVSTEMRQLLTGEPTERTEHTGQVEVTDARERLAHLITQYASRAGAVADTERAN